MEIHSTLSPSLSSNCARRHFDSNRRIDISILDNKILPSSASGRDGDWGLDDDGAFCLSGAASGSAHRHTGDKEGKRHNVLSGKAQNLCQSVYREEREVIQKKKFSICVLTTNRTNSAVIKK